MEPGIYKELSNEEYHADAAISRSGIMMFMDSPYKYWAHYINPERPPKESTKAMDFGSAFHSWMLEPDKFGDEYSVLPRKKLCRDVGRDAYDANEHNIRAVKQNLAKNIIITHDEYDLLLEMDSALKQHNEAWDLIQDAIYEQSYFWQDVESGLMLKARPDILHNNMIVDLKTCANAASYAYQRAMVDGGYHIQGAMCREAVRAVEGRTIDAVINVCIEKVYPYAIGIKIIGEDALRAGHEEFKATLMQMKKCFETNNWPSYEPETVELPGWYS